MRSVTIADDTAELCSYVSAVIDLGIVAIDLFEYRGEARVVDGTRAVANLVKAAFNTSIDIAGACADYLVSTRPDR